MLEATGTFWKDSINRYALYSDFWHIFPILDCWSHFILNPGQVGILSDAWHPEATQESALPLWEPFSDFIHHFSDFILFSTFPRDV